MYSSHLQPTDPHSPETVAPPPPRRPTGAQTHIHTDRQTDIQTDRQRTDRQTDRQTGQTAQTGQDRTDTQAHTHTHTLTHTFHKNCPERVHERITAGRSTTHEFRVLSASYSPRTYADYKPNHHGMDLKTRRMIEPRQAKVVAGTTRAICLSGRDAHNIQSGSGSLPMSNLLSISSSYSESWCA